MRIPSRIRVKLLNSLIIAFIFVSIIQGITILISGFESETIINGFILFFIIGLTIALMEIFIFQNLFRRRSLLLKTAIQTIVYVILIAIITLWRAVATSRIYIKEHPDLFEEFSFYSLQTFANNPQDYLQNNWEEFLAALFSLFFLIFLVNFISQISRKIGHSQLLNYISGYYRIPRDEDRIFMFLDLKSSTQIAETLHHHSFHELLNDFFYDLSEPIVRYDGEIYQYVGDEVVVSWQISRGLRNGNCIRCYFACKKMISEHESHYLEKYNLQPDFRASLHCGTVTTSEIGDVKSEIVFHGDVLNTSSRILALTSKLNTDLLISSKLNDMLILPNEYRRVSKGSFELKGKQQEVELLGIIMRDPKNGIEEADKQNFETFNR